MQQKRNWWYNEFQQVGKDYSERKEVEVYESSHSQFRDVDAENDVVLRKLGLSGRETIVDMGAGTGAFAASAAKMCRKVYAVDVSEAMLDANRARVERAGKSNIELCHAGFLDFEPENGKIDAVVTSFALHHLPDFWKGVALKRIHQMMKANGLLFIRDVVIEEDEALANIDRFTAKQSALGGAFLKNDAEAHFREEFSTYDWIMEALLERAGFGIVEKAIEDGLIAEYLCRKRV